MSKYGNNGQRIALNGNAILELAYYGLAWGGSCMCGFTVLLQNPIAAVESVPISIFAGVGIFSS